jgi:protein associated with RNAse G/E
MTVKLVEDKKIWDDFVDKSPNGLLFHRRDFIDLLEKHTGYHALTYGIYKNQALKCIFPLFYRNYRGLKMLFSPPPSTGIPYMGFIMEHDFMTFKQNKKESIVNFCMEELFNEIKTLNANYISLSTAPYIVDIRPFKWDDYDVDMKYTYTIDLNKDLDSIWEGFGKDCKQSIKNFSKSSVCLKEVKDANKLYDIMEKTYHQQGLNLPIVSAEFLEEIISTFPDNFKIYFLYRDDQIVDVEMAYMYKGVYKLWIGGAVIQKDVHGGQEYSTWELIRKAKEEGCHKFEIVGANTKRLCAYQSKFNPSLEFIFSIEKKDTIGNIGEFVYQNLVKKKVF